VEFEQASLGGTWLSGSVRLFGPAAKGLSSNESSLAVYQSEARDSSAPRRCCMGPPAAKDAAIRMTKLGSVLVSVLASKVV
jgi:hypothetical protein